MDERQPSLFRAPRAPEVELGRELLSTPPRLELGDPASIAWARAQEAELARRQELQRHDEQRARRSAGQRRRAERQRDGYPPEEVVATALRGEVWADYGMPPKRMRLVERAVDRLRQEYPGVPLEHVQAIFTRAVEAGRLRREGRHWVWAPPSAGNRRFRSAIARAILEHTVLLRVEGVALGLGTLMGSGSDAVVATTQGVLDELRAVDAPLELVGRRGEQIQVERQLLESDELGARLPGIESPLGPDLALLRPPRMALERLMAMGKSPHVCEEAFLAEGRVHAIAGSPVAAQARLQAVTLRRRFHESFNGMALDFLDAERESRAPWLPGAGIWSAILDGAGAWQGTLHLEGIAFREEGAMVRGHGMRTLKCMLDRRSPA